MRAAFGKRRGDDVYGPFIGEGRAKLLLFGEHAAVYGHPAVGLALPERLRVRLEFNEDQDEPCWRLDGVDDGDAERLRTLLPNFTKILPPRLAALNGRLEIDSTVPRGMGFGSSAALCVALASAFRAASSRPGSAPAGGSVWQDAHDAEKFFHGTPSGIDTGLAVLGGLQRFSPHPPALPEARALTGFPLFLVTGAVPRLESCGESIRAVRAAVERGDKSVSARLRALGRMADEASETLDSADISGTDRLGVLADMAMAELRVLGLSTPALDELLEEGKAGGALGGKLSGAGGGGAFYLLYPSQAKAEAAAERLCRRVEKAGAETTSLIRGWCWKPQFVDKI
jgi:mevalonate kinase